MVERWGRGTQKIVELCIKAGHPPERTLREDLIHLKRLGLVVSEGFGRGAIWHLKREEK